MVRTNDETNEDVLSTEGKGETFADVLERSISRRGLLKGGLATGAAIVAAPVFGNVGSARAQATAPAAPTLDFQPIAPSTANNMTVAPNHTASVLLRWGDPIKAGAPALDINNQTMESQSMQFGYNCDFVGFMPLPLGSNSSDRGLLVVNHEYTNPELMFPGYDDDNPTKVQVDVEMAAHGLSVVEVRRDSSGKWNYVQDSPYNRRLTAMSPMGVSGPAAGNALLKTKDDPSGNRILGTLNNCAAGKTPWGTVLTAEENFHQYFANLDKLGDIDPRKKLLSRLGLTRAASERKWERFYERFDISIEPNESFRHGWIVEVDPYDPTSTPIKRTALGRFKHEACTTVVTPNNRVVLYTGDDERFEYVYKFVSTRSYSATDRKANMGLLDEGTLYVAKFNDDGTGVWLPLTFGQNGLTADKGFNSQGDVVMNARLAGDAVGATKMDRPEDIEPNPVNGRVYMVMTNNTQRGTSNRPAPDAANPRVENRHGHIIEVTEANGDHTSTTFNWNMFLVCGEPKDNSTYFAGFPKDRVSPISSPDNIAFDNMGNLWIATDGQPGTLKVNDGFFAVPVEGEDRGYLRQFFSGVPGGEVCGPEFTPDNTSLFLAIQHPGEGGTVEKPVSQWPDNAVAPRPSVVVVQPAQGRIGMSQPIQAAAPPAANPQTPSGMPRTGGPNLTEMAGPLGVAAGIGAAALGALIAIRNREKKEDAEGETGN
jgi:uncharacterized protein